MEVATTGAPAVSGLSEAEAARRLRERPASRAASSRSYWSIVRANTFTVFNAILGTFGALTLIFGSPKDALFLGVVVANAAIGIGQEVRAKRTLDRLAALVAPTARVLRDGVARMVGVEQVVVGDVLRLAAGDQVVADGTLLEADGLALDESNLTGESEPAARVVGERGLSGSFVVEGAGALEVTAVGAESQAEKVAGEARAFRHPRSPLERAMDRLLVVLAVVMVPLGTALIVSLLVRDEPIDDAVETATAGIVNLVPEGLILLASLTAAVGAQRMARRGALAQQLNAVESLASVDTICSDKTGTLTRADLRVIATVPAAGVEPAELERAVARFAASAPTRNATLEAIAAAGLGGDGIVAEAVEAQVPFSSARRWSALQIGGECLVLGAPERFPLDGDSHQAAPPATDGDGSGESGGVGARLHARAAAEAAAGRRVLAFGLAPGPLPEATPDAPPPAGLRTLGLAVLAEQLRDETRRTVEFFVRESVDLRVLSGDAPPTVGAIATDAGIPGDAPPLDGEALPEDPDELRRSVLAAPAVGRISPQGKRRVVEALEAGDRYVGMIGDGVNDVPALKAARLAIAQGSGTQMARAVADVVLVRGDFAAVPSMVGEGRQILRNLQRVARLFVTKSVLVALMVIAVGVVTGFFPLLPRQFTLASTLTIGIPAFVLALSPSSGSWRPDRFLANVLRFSIPAGLGIGIGVIGAYYLARHGLDLSLEQARTVATTVVVAGGLAIVVLLEADSGQRRMLAVLGLCAAMVVLQALALAIPFARDFFALATPTGDMALAFAAGAVGGIALALLGLWAARGRREEDGGRGAAGS